MSASVKRYDLLTHDHLIEVPHGAWVASADFDSLEQQLREAQAALMPTDGPVPKPAESYEGLLRQFRAAFALVQAKTKMAEYWRAQCSESSAQKVRELRAQLSAERDTNASLTSALLAAEEERDQLREEVAGLQADADRLNWMIEDECRIHGYLTQAGPRYGIVWPTLSESQVDLFADPRAAIDAARGVQS